MSRLISAPIVILCALWITGCATAEPERRADVPAEEPIFTNERLIRADIERAIVMHDPWEGLNRRVYRFNYNLDKYALIPAVNGYRAVVPRPARKGVSNFFNNLFEIRTLVNQLLQLRPGPAMETTGRFMINTTAGILGLVDVASKADVPYHKEDFGQTLGVWGVPQGPYAVWPFLGPSNLRDGFGYLVDAAWFSVLDPLNITSDWRAAAVYYPLLIIDTRQAIAFRYHQTGSPFEYELVRLMMTTKRELDVRK